MGREAEITTSRRAVVILKITKGGSVQKMSSTPIEVGLETVDPKHAKAQISAYLRE